MIVLFIILFFILFLFFRKDNFSYTLLVLLTVITFFIQYLAGRSLKYNSFISILNVCFICINIFLIIKPWSFANITAVENANVKFVSYFKKYLYIVLFINLILNSAILVIVYTYIPDIAEFKSEAAYLKLYEQIPYFANVFRFAYITQNAGYLAIPLFYYHLGKSEKKDAIYAFIFSFSSILSGFAFYSRAQIFTYTLIFIIYFFLIKKTLPNLIKSKILKFIKYSVICIVALFLIITYLRFTAMDYYGDRIPEDSFTKNPVVYSLFDYASQSYSNGLKQLDLFTEKKDLGGEQFFRDVYQILNFFGLMAWDVKESQEKIDKAYGYDGGAFNGYTAPLVFNFGYIATFIISLLYYFITKFKLKRRNNLPLNAMFSIVLLLFIPTVSIFYTGYAILLFPVVFLGVINFSFFFKRLFRKSSDNAVFQ